MARILFVAPQPSSFVELDRELLAERHEVVPVYGRRPPRNLRALARAVRRADVVFGWWAHLHTLVPFALASRAGTPTVLVVGGFDTANLPEIGYGNQRGGWRRRVSRFVMARADVLATNARYSVGELERNAGIPPERVTVVHHGVPDLFRADPADPERRAITVGNVDAVNFERKGLHPFVLAAAELPDVRFEVVGRDVDGTAAKLRAIAPSWRRACAGPPRTCRPPSTRASGCRWPRRCSPARSRWSRRPARCPRSSAMSASWSTTPLRPRWPPPSAGRSTRGPTAGAPRASACCASSA